MQQTFEMRRAAAAQRLASSAACAAAWANVGRGIAHTNVVLALTTPPNAISTAEADKLAETFVAFVYASKDSAEFKSTMNQRALAFDQRVKEYAAICTGDDGLAAVSILRPTG